MLTQQEIIREILTFPIIEQFEIIEKIQSNIKKNLQTQKAEKKEITVEEKRAIVKSLAGSLKMKNPPLTKAEERKMVEDYLEEKYR